MVEISALIISCTDVENLTHVTQLIQPSGENPTQLNAICQFF